MQITSGSTIASAGSGYAIGDTITLVGGTSSAVAVLTVATLSGSGVATFTVTTAGIYTVLPSNPISTTSSGAGTGFTLTGSWTVRGTSFTITNAGSGYVEQPTVTFSSGSATAYATVGSDTTIKSLGTNLNLSTPSGTALQVADVQTGTVVNNWVFRGAAGTGTQSLIGSTAGTATNLNLLWLTKGGSGLHQFATSGSSSNIQFQVSNTASAVNYVQVTGAATGGNVVISAQGSDTNVNMQFQRKGSGNFQFSGSTYLGTNGANNLLFAGAATTLSPSMSAVGTDTDIDLTLTPKGAGAVRFGTYTGTILTPTGYITIKTSDGTTRRLLVG